MKLQPSNCNQNSQTNKSSIHSLQTRKYPVKIMLKNTMKTFTEESYVPTFAPGINKKEEIIPLN